MGCEESFIIIKLIWHGYLVPSLDICVHETLTETGLSWLAFEQDLITSKKQLSFLIPKA